MPYTLPNINVFLRRFLLALILPFIAQVLLAFILFGSILSLRSTIQWVDHTYRVITQVEALRYGVEQTKRNILHYLLTSRVIYKQSALAHVRDLILQIEQLSGFVSDNPIQVRRLQTVRTELLRWEQTIERSQPISQSPFFTIAQSVTNELTNMVAEERRLLALRNKSYTNRMLTTYILLSILVLATLFLMGWSLFILRQLAIEYNRSLTLVQKHSDQIQAEKELRDKILENSFISVAMLDKEGRFTYLNPRAALDLGYKPEELVGKHFRALLPEEEQARVEELFRLSVENQAPLRIAETRVVRKDGSIGLFSFGWSPLFEKGELVGIVAFGEDLTEKRRLEQELLQAQKLESIGRLAGGIAHDFNNILTAIFGYMELASGELPADHPVQARLRDTEKAAETAAGLTQQLLAFARRQIIQPRLLLLNVLVRELQPMLQRLIGEHIELEVREHSVHPIRADVGQMEQILVNLCVNARDAMPNGGSLTIEVADAAIDAEYAKRHEGVSPGNYVMLSVSDTGVGMEESIQQHVFEPFFTTKQMGQGTGLGLATSYGIVKQAGGHIWLYSEPGHGTTFKIFLPQVEDLVEEKEEAPLALSPLPGGTETILIAEDEVLVREVAAAALRAQGYTVLEAANGVEAMHIARQHDGPIHLLISDAIMPQMSGRELAEQLQGQGLVQRVLYVSGYTENAIVHQGVLEEGIFLLAKPFTPSSLLAKVREVLDTPLTQGTES